MRVSASIVLRLVYSHVMQMGVGMHQNPKITEAEIARDRFDWQVVQALPWSCLNSKIPGDFKKSDRLN